LSDTLVLNSDALPVSYLPLSTISWQEAIKYMLLEKVNVIDWYDNWIVRSVSWSIPVPAVIMFKDYFKPKNYVRFSRSNVYLRDSYTCLYCNRSIDKNNCTLDHVLPISKGGKTTFENTVTSCNRCNAAKGNSTKLKPKIMPYRPSYFELVNKRKLFSFNIRHKSWQMFLT